MAQAAIMIINIIFFLILSLSFLPCTMSAGFTLKLIHRDSPLSPLYQPNISDFERFLKHVEISKARASYFQQHMGEGSSKPEQKTSIRLPSRFLEPLFTAEIGIGTPAVKRTLIFDTGSSLTWTQCSPCMECFHQNEPLFDPTRSTSYHTITRNHPLARGFTCTPSGCTYYVGYNSGQHTGGDAALESFTFQTNQPTPATVFNLAFGCGRSNVGHYPPMISGILGMNREPLSIARQLGVMMSRFSYCFSPSSSSHVTTSYVNFGDEAMIRGSKPKKTPFLNNNYHYGLNLIDLSFNGKKLGLGKAAFPDGIYVDSGAALTLLNGRAYNAARDSVVKYFSKFKNVNRYEGGAGMDNLLCYSYPAGFDSFPSMTFHFKGAALEVPPSNLFFNVQVNVRCLSMKESNGVNLLGAFHQRSVRFLFDLRDNMLSFAPEDC